MKLYNYKVTVEIHEEDKPEVMGERFVVAEHCAVAAAMVEEEFNVFAVDAIRISEVDLNNDKGHAEAWPGEG